MVVANFTEKRQTVVVGAGPGGYVAAIRAAQEGQEVTIIEREYMGGVCLNVGCIPSKALISASTRYQEAQTENAEVFGVTTENVQIDWAKTQEWKQTGVVDRMTNGVESLLKKNNVEIVKGNAYFNGKNTVHVDGDNPITYEFENAIIATGSSPIEIPGFKYGGRVLDSTGALNLEEIPESIVFIGGGVIGSELGGVYSRLGSKVTILEGAKNILGTYERDMIRLVTQQFEKEGTEIVTSALAKEAVDNGDSVTVKYEVDGEEKEVTADYVVVTVGRSPNTDDIGLEGLGVEVDERGYVKVDDQGRTTNEKVFAIGDIVPGAALAHKASYEAKVAAEAISGGAGVVDYKAMPAVSFTHPELATTGMTKADAKEAGIKVNTTKFLYGGNGRAVSMDAAEGFVRLITTKDENVIVGADVAGAGASDLIAELTLAIEAGMNAEDIALTVHAHPTLAEMIMDAAESALGQPIHS